MLAGSLPHSHLSSPLCTFPAHLASQLWGTLPLAVEPQKSVYIKELFSGPVLVQVVANLSTAKDFSDVKCADLKKYIYM